MDSRVVKFTLRFHHPGKTKREEERDCGGSDWNMTWREFMAKYYSFNLQSHHEIKSTISTGTVFKPNNKVKDFMTVFSRHVSKCVVRIVSKESDKTPNKGTGSGSNSNAVAKMAKNLQVPPKKAWVQAQSAKPESPAPKKKMPPAPPAPKISNVNGVKNTTTTTTTTRSGNQNQRERHLSNSTQRVSRVDTPGTSGYLNKNLFNPNLPVSSTATVDVNARLYKRKYPEDDIRFPKAARPSTSTINDDDLDTASQLARNQNGFDFDDASSVCSQDSIDSQDDTSLSDVRTVILKRWAKCSNTDFHKMLAEYRNFDSERKLKWMRRHPITNCCLGMVYEGLK